MQIARNKCHLTNEVGTLAEHLKMNIDATKEKYIEESQQGNYFINTIPCHFLKPIINVPFMNIALRECRDFPHLHKPGFKARLPGTLMHYGRCPIVYNVIEEMKLLLGFFEEQTE